MYWRRDMSAHWGSVRAGTASVIEAVDLHEHFPMAGAEEVPPLAEEEIQAAAVVFQIRGAVLDAEGHVGFLRGDIEFVEKADEIGIGGVVEDHEPGIDGHGAAGFIDGDGVGVAAGVVVFFEKGDVVMRVEAVGGSESGDAGADDGDGGHGGREGEVGSWQFSVFSLQSSGSDCGCLWLRGRGGFG